MSDQEICDINRLPLGLLEFSNIRNNDMIYVDKTNLIYKIANQRSPIFFFHAQDVLENLFLLILLSVYFPKV